MATFKTGDRVIVTALATLLFRGSEYNAVLHQHLVGEVYPGWNDEPNVIEVYFPNISRGWFGRFRAEELDYAPFSDDNATAQALQRHLAKLRSQRKALLAQLREIDSALRADVMPAHVLLEDGGTDVWQIVAFGDAESVESEYIRRLRFDNGRLINPRMLTPSEVVEYCNLKEGE